MLLLKKYKLKSLVKEDGVSLVEVVASIVILAIVLLFFANFFPQMSVTNQKNVDKNRAVNLAAEELIHWQSKLKTELETFKTGATKISCTLEEKNNLLL